MIDFKPVTLGDKAWVDELVLAENSPSADYNFGNLYIWDRTYKQRIARCGDRLLTEFACEGERALVFPIGRGPLEPAIAALTDYAAQNGRVLTLYGVTEGHRALLEELWPGRFVFDTDEGTYDYLYRAERLATYAGKALHAKKNHCNRFEAENDWDFRPLTRELIPDCIDMLELWSEENSARLDPSVSEEHAAILRAFDAYEALGLEGGALFADGQIVGFSLGSMISADTFDVYFEKAEVSLNGAYPMVCRELTRLLLLRHPGLVYMNREDDMGLESLRQSKLSYRPETLLVKYVARE